MISYESLQGTYFNRDDVSYRGFAKFFSKMAEERREQAEKLMAYMNKRGGRVHYKKLSVSVSIRDMSRKKVPAQNTYKTMVKYKITVKSNLCKNQWRIQGGRGRRWRAPPILDRQAIFFNFRLPTVVSSDLAPPIQTSPPPYPKIPDTPLRMYIWM